MLNRRTTLRAVLALVAATLAVAGLSGCRTDPTVAAYIGNQQISVRQLNDEVAQREADDPAVATYAKGHRAAFDRQVLSTLVDRKVYAEAARRYAVTVDDADVRARYAELVAAEGTDQQSLEQSAAQAGVTRSDLLEQVRNLVIAERIAAATGHGDPLSEAALRQRYQQALPTLAQKQIGVISVADQATATAVLDRLTADPASYPTVAAQYAGQNTLPTMQAIDPSQLRADVANGVASAAPNTGFTVPVQGAGVAVVFVGSATVPTYEELRPQLVAQAQTSLDSAGASLVAKVRSGMRITINPRYSSAPAASTKTSPPPTVRILGSGGGQAATAPAGG